MARAKGLSSSHHDWIKSVPWPTHHKNFAISETETKEKAQKISFVDDDDDERVRVVGIVVAIAQSDETNARLVDPNNRGATHSGDQKPE
jgi:hypothetical protein